MNAIDALRREHTVIEAVLDCLDAACESVASGEPVCEKTFREGLRFLRGYTEETHHQKEEEDFFPLLEERGVAREGGPIGMLLIEHGEIRGMLEDIEQTLVEVKDGEEGATRRLRQIVGQFTRQVRGHMHREDQDVFTLAHRVLGSQDLLDLANAFETADMGGGMVDQFLDLARNLCDRWGVPFPEDTAAMP